MKKFLITLSCIIGFNDIYSQHHLYLGFKAGAGYGNEMYKLTGLVFASDFSPSLEIMQTHNLKTNTSAVCSDAKFEILYGYKRFRIGYLLDYLYFKGINYTSSLTPPETSSSFGIFKGKSSVVGHFIGNSLLIEVTAFQKKYFSVSPNISLGYFNTLGKSVAKNKNYFQSGVGLMFGFEVKDITLYINPDYTIRCSKDQYVAGTTFKNPFRLYQSALINLGIRGDMLSLKKDKAKK